MVCGSLAKARPWFWVAGVQRPGLEVWWSRVEVMEPNSSLGFLHTQFGLVCRLLHQVGINTCLGALQEELPASTGFLPTHPSGRH